jgi:hypothetical protein
VIDWTEDDDRAAHEAHADRAARGFPPPEFTEMEEEDFTLADLRADPEMWPRLRRDAAASGLRWADEDDRY